MTNYAAAAKRVRAAKTPAQIKSVEKSLVRLYDAGALSVSELGRLDALLMKQASKQRNPRGLSAKQLINMSRYGSKASAARGVTEQTRIQRRPMTAVKGPGDYYFVVPKASALQVRAMVREARSNPKGSTGVKGPYTIYRDNGTSAGTTTRKAEARQMAELLASAMREGHATAKDASGKVVAKYRASYFGPKKINSSRRSPVRKSNPINEQRELEMFIINDGELYRSQHEPIQRNFINKAAKGKFSKTLAKKGMRHLVDRGAKKYVKEFGGGPWNKLFSVADRNAVAEELVNDFLYSAKGGDLDYLLQKQYQGKWSGVQMKQNPRPGYRRRTKTTTRRKTTRTVRRTVKTVSNPRGVKASRWGVYVKDRLAYVSTAKLDANKAASKLKLSGRAYIKVKAVKPNPITGKLPKVGWRTEFKKAAYAAVKAPAKRRAAAGATASVRRTLDRTRRFDRELRDASGRFVSTARRAGSKRNPGAWTYRLVDKAGKTYQGYYFGGEYGGGKAEAQRTADIINRQQARGGSEKIRVKARAAKKRNSSASILIRRERNPTIEPVDARETLAQLGIPLGTDTDTLPSDVMRELAAEARRRKYRKSKSAPGSTGRMFHEYLQRRARAKTSRRNSSFRGKLGTGTRFANCVKKMKGRSKDPEGLCAAIGRRKYGKKGMARLAAGGRKKNPMLQGHKAIEWAERHGRKTVSKYADAVSGARKYLPLDEARDVAREDPSLIYLKVGAKQRRAARSSAAGRKNPSRKSKSYGNGLYRAWSPVNQAWFLLWGKSSTPMREKHLLGTYNTVAELEDRVKDLQRDVPGGEFSRKSNPSRRSKTSSSSASTAAGRKGYGVWVGERLVWTGTKKADCSKAILLLQDAGRKGIKGFEVRIKGAGMGWRKGTKPSARAVAKRNPGWPGAPSGARYGVSAGPERKFSKTKKAALKTAQRLARLYDVKAEVWDIRQDWPDLVERIDRPPAR